MAVDRRKFLKIAGASALLGLGGKTAIDIFAPGELEASMESEIPPVTKDKKWAMVIDMRKCLEQQDKADRSAIHGRDHSRPPRLPALSWGAGRSSPSSCSDLSPDYVRNKTLQFAASLI